VFTVGTCDCVMVVFIWLHERSAGVFADGTCDCVIVILV